MPRGDEKSMYIIVGALAMLTTGGSYFKASESGSSPLIGLGVGLVVGAIAVILMWWRSIKDNPIGSLICTGIGVVIGLGLHGFGVADWISFAAFWLITTGLIWILTESITTSPGLLDLPVEHSADHHKL